MTTHHITLDLDKTLRTPPPLVTARQGDTRCGITASVTDHGAPASLAGYTARFQAAKPDGTYADQAAEVSGSTVSVTLAPEFLAAEGLIKTAYFRFFEGTDEKESTQNLAIRVLHDAEGEAPDPTGDYISEVDGLISEVQGALEDVNEAVEDASDATTAANSAASSANSAASNANAAALEADAAAEAAQSAIGAMTGNVLKGETEAGDVASASDAYAQTPLGMTVRGETRQNLWSNPEGTSNGITVASNADGSIAVSGTSTGAVSISGGGVYVLKPSTQYTLSVDKALSSGSDASGGSFFVEFYSSDSSAIADSTVNVGYGSISSASFTAPAGMSYAVLGVACGTGATMTGDYHVMLNEGSTAEPWCPPGLNSVGQLREDERNLWVNPSGTSNGITATSNADGSVTLSGTSTSTTATIQVLSYNLKPSTRYTFSVDKQIIGGNCGFVIVQRNSEGATIGRNTVIGKDGLFNAAFTTRSDVASASLQVYCNIQGTTVSGTYRVMLNEGSTPAPWVPPGCETAVQVVTSGKNILPKPKYIYRISGTSTSFTSDGITWSLNDDGTISTSGTATVKTYCYIDFGGEFFVPAGDYSMSSTLSGFIRNGLPNIASSKFSLNEPTMISKAYIMVNVGGSAPETVYPQLEFGSTATDYEPPQPIALTPIDLDGHVLASLPDGTRDELVIGQDGAATIEGTCGYVESYTDEDVGEDYVASALDSDGGIAQGAQVVYKLDAAQSSTVPSVALPALPMPSFNAWVQPGECEVAGDISVEYAKDVNLVVGSLEERVSALEQLHAPSGGDA